MLKMIISKRQISKCIYLYTVRRYPLLREKRIERPHTQRIYIANELQIPLLIFIILHFHF